MLKKTKDYIEEFHMISKGEKVIVGISGGADSVCLLFMLSKLRDELSFSIEGVHINHGIRPEAGEDEAFVRALCEELQIPCRFYSVDVKMFAADQHLSEEEAGRILRRECFEKTMKELGGSKIALAHHLNDNAETMLLNLARGTGILGLCGMQPVSEPYIRPLLQVSREEIEAFLEEHQIEYCTDKTNLSDAYARNRIRHHVVPYLEQEINDRAVTHMNETMQQLRTIQEYLQQQAKNFFDRCVKETENGYIVKKDFFETIPEVFKPMIIGMVLEELAGQKKDIRTIHLNLAEELFEKQVGRSLDMPYNIRVKRVYEGILFEKTETKISRPEEHKLTPEEGVTKEVHWGGYVVEYSLIKKSDFSQNDMENSSMKTFDYDIMNESLVARGRQTGDRIYLDKVGTQKLKAFFVNQKIGQDERDRILLIASGNQVIWAYGYRADSRYQVTEQTKNILKIQIKKEKSYGREN